MVPMSFTMAVKRRTLSGVKWPVSELATVRIPKVWPSALTGMQLMDFVPYETGLFWARESAG